MFIMLLFLRSAAVHNELPHAYFYLETTYNGSDI